MLDKLKSNTRYIYFALISLSLFVLMLISETSLNRFDTDDFKVFYLAAKALINGNEVYGVAFGLDTGFYKYSPFTLMLFTGYTLFSYKEASIIHFAIVAISGITSIFLMESIVDKYLFKIKKKNLLAFIFIFLGILIHLIRDLHMGNTNAILVLLLVLALKLSLESRQIAAGILLALAILTKPYFIILMLPFLLAKKYKVFFSTAISGTVFTLSTGLILGFSESFTLHTQWIQEMLRHSVYLYSPYTIPYLLDYYLGFSALGKIQFPFFGLMILGVSAYFWYQQKSDHSAENMTKSNRTLIFFYFILIAIIPSLLITDVEHFIFSMPLIAILVYALKKKPNYYLIALMVITILIFGGNSSDLVGNELTLKIKFWGWVGIGNILFIVGSFAAFNWLRKSESDKSIEAH